MSKSGCFYTLGFFYVLKTALDRIHQFSADQLNGLSDLLCPELINQCLEDTGVATLRKRRLPME
ncbi:transposase domain-containing protein, partial [Vibrio cholerae]|nr:transposase domain-containing protein [Vibrio cholerae]